ncbi:MAG TPA: fibronectin type III domain-containing protein [Candidatus Eisenbacteria bacterium]|nr:fibronectin type III domain-containing protein [Candidatus Eisenbacteria bacterium]
MRSGSPVLLVLLVGMVTADGAAQAQTVTASSVQLSWTTPGDDSLTGTASQFDLRYSTAPITAGNFASATRWTGTPSPGAPGTHQSATVTGLQPSTTYWFAIKTGDEVPNWSGMSNVLSRTTLAGPDAVRPAAIANLSITGSTETTIALAWNATGDDSLTGTATGYDLRYSTSPITNANWSSATQVSGEPSPGAPGAAQSHTVTGLSRQTRYYFAIKVSDDGGNLSALSNVPNATTPDLTRPAAINDLAVGFVWLGATAFEPLAARPAWRGARRTPVHQGRGRM